MAKANKLPGVRTDPAALKSLPQFQTDLSFEIDHLDPLTGEYRAYPPIRQAALIQVLTNGVLRHLQKFNPGKRKARLERFLREAFSAIATYEHRRKEQGDFDRAQAKKVVLAAHKAVSDARGALLRVASDPRLSRFLELLFVHQKPGAVLSDRSSNRRRDAKALSKQIEQSEQSLRGYRCLGPKAVADQLFRLEPVLFLAAERLEFQPGDIQRDEIARTFTDMMATAWMEATETIPSYAQPSPRTTRPSPFAELLATVNQNCLASKYRSKNDFRDHARASIRKLKPRQLKGR
jgi:hypothetical protein